MTELAQGTQGDAVSRLLQLEAKTLRIGGMRWTGKWHEDVRLLMTELDNARTFRDSLLRSMEALLRMAEANALPEVMQAKLCATILNARAELDLHIETRNKIIEGKKP